MKIDAYRKYIWLAVNIISVAFLGLLLQIGGAYIVNAAVNCIEDAASSGQAGALAESARQYGSFMESIRSIEPRQFVHVIFVAPLVEEIVFRLIFLRAGKMVMPFWAANLVQAVLFGIYHTVAIQRIYGAVMGLIIGCVFHYCPLIYRLAYDKEDPGGRSEAASEKKRPGMLDLPDCLIGVMITFWLHVCINASGLLIAPRLSADIPYAAQFIIGTAFMLAAAAVCIFLRRQAGGRSRS
ncbi:MAG: CPBP family intramembrane metalloprotease [Lachnospiraceae bacterium]|nr:CPBP family intramembrane metalloprotease [Lachnospiraceae bacterium]